ncbi:MAG: hypothetical protein WC960_07120 [Bacteroidales bacterium]
MVRFKIADHIIDIEGVTSQEAAQFLPSFAPFILDKSASPPLLKVVVGAQIEAPSPLALPLEQFSRNSFAYTIFKGEGHSLIVEIGRKNGSTIQTLKKRYLMHLSKERGVAECNFLLDSAAKGFILSSFIMIAFTLASAEESSTKIHASAIVKGGRAILFLGKSGTGKSTHARLWVENIEGAKLLNDDEPIVRIMEDGKLFAYGSPWSGKTPCYINSRAEVAAFVLLEQAKENRLKKLEGVEAFTGIYQSAAILRSNSEHRQELFQNISKIITLAPTYSLKCLPNRDAVLLSHSILELYEDKAN